MLAYAVSQVFTATDASKFADQFVSELASNRYNSTIGLRSFNKAIINVMRGESRGVAPLSYMFVIGDAANLDANRMPEALDLCSKLHIKVSYFILNDTSAPGGQPSYSSEPVDSMISLARLTGGDFYQVADYTQFQYLWTLNLLNLFRSYQVGMVQSGQCSKLAEYIQVPGDSDRLIVEVFSPVKPVNVTIYNEQGVRSSWGAGETKSNTNYYFQLGYRRNLRPGLWKMEITQDDPSFCYASVRSLSKNEVNVAFNWDAAVDQGGHSNEYKYFPAGSSNAIVATASTGTLTSVQIFDKDEAKLHWASPLRQRLNCSYEYSSLQ